MTRLILNRLLGAVPVLFIVSVVVFMLTYLVPGDPAVVLAGETATPEMIEQTRARLGLDRSPAVQYWDWVTGVLTGDFGTSLFTGYPVGELITDRLPVTVSLALGALVVGVVVGIPAGIIAAVRQGTRTDRALTLVTSLGVSTPNYVIAILLVGVFALRLQWFPATGYVSIAEGGVVTWAQHLALPWVTLGLLVAAVVTRMLRSSLVGVLGQDYVRMSRSKGMREGTVVLKHSLKNGMIPVITVIGTQFAYLLGGAVVVEQIFGIQGLGSAALSAVTSRDIPAVQGIVVLAAVAVLVVNLLVDISYAWFNPKVRQ